MEIVPVADLRVGMFVAEPDCAWTELPFPLQGFVISSPKQVDVFQSQCRFVYVDRTRSRHEHYRENRRDRDRPLRGKPFERGVAGQLRYRHERFLDFLQQQDGSDHVRELSGELAYVESRFTGLQGALDSTLRNISIEKEIDLGHVRAGLHDIAGSLQRNPDAMMWLLRLRRFDESSFDQAIDVGVYLLLLGSHIGWRGERLINLGIAGLLQDIGKSRLPKALLTKSEPLNAPEIALIRSHVANSLEILCVRGNLPSEVLITISRHHERWDGSGYPQALLREQIGLAGEMAGLVDTFCALIKETPYRPALGHQQALEAIHDQRGKLFNPGLLEQFVQCVGLYPIGTLVELDDGAVGVVVQQSRVQRARPRILLLLDGDKAALSDYRVIDLRDKSAAGRRVTRSLPLGAYGLSSDDYYLR